MTFLSSASPSSTRVLANAPPDTRKLANGWPTRNRIRADLTARSAAGCSGGARVDHGERVPRRRPVLERAALEAQIDRGAVCDRQLALRHRPWRVRYLEAS